MNVVGLTGGIACGKSSVAALLARRGVCVVDADEVARAVVARGSEGLGAVVEAFGAGVLDAQGELDRKALAARVFGDDERRRALNALLHPRIAVESGRRLAALGEAGARWAVYDAALLVENGAHRGFAALLVVTAPESVQRARLRARDGLDEAAAQARLAAQWPLARKVAEATWVLDNGGERAALAARAAAVYAALAVRFGDPGRAAR